MIHQSDSHFNHLDQNQILERIAIALEQVASSNQRNNELLDYLIGERSPKPKVMPLSEAWKELGYPSRQACYRRIKNNHYRLGHEVVDRRSPDSPDPLYYLDIEACRARDKVIPPKRGC